METSKHQQDDNQGTLPPERILVFFSYAHRDQTLRDQLENHLSILKYRGLITTWHAKEISAGQETIEKIDIHLHTAHIILLLISANFLASEYCVSRELLSALERHERGEAHVIPVLLRPVLFTDAPFAKLQPLPTNGKPVTRWSDRDLAFVDIARSIEQLVLSLRARAPTIPPRPESATFRPGRDDTAATLIAPEFSTRSMDDEASIEAPGVPPPSSVPAPAPVTKTPAGTQSASTGGNRDMTSPSAQTDATVTFSRLTSITRPPFPFAERALYYLRALSAYEQALHEKSTDADALRGKGNALVGLGRYKKALATFEQAVALSPQATTYTNMGNVLAALWRYEEAVAAYQQALRLDATYASAYTGLSEALSRLGRTQEAEQACAEAKQLGDDED